MKWDDVNLLETLKNGGVAVMPTDTLYGIVGSSLNSSTVKRIYQIKKRTAGKLCINLIGSLEELKKFNINILSEQVKLIESFSEPTSFIIDGISFRLPKDRELQQLLLQTGPLIAPSANREGMQPAVNINEAKAYFGDDVDLYIDGGTIQGKASRLVRLHPDGSADILRE